MGGSRSHSVTEKLPLVTDGPLEFDQWLLPGVTAAHSAVTHRCCSRGGHGRVAACVLERRAWSAAEYEMTAVQNDGAVRTENSRLPLKPAGVGPCNRLCCQLQCSRDSRVCWLLLVQDCCCTRDSPHHDNAAAGVHHWADTDTREQWGRQQAQRQWAWHPPRDAHLSGSAHCCQ